MIFFNFVTYCALACGSEHMYGGGEVHGSSIAMQIIWFHPFQL
jgi:hypothetical protein